MTPKILLSLWRERWGKVDASVYERPWVSGIVDQWGDRLTQSIVWDVPGLSWVTTTLFFALVWLLSTVKFTLTDQWVMSIFVLLVSVSIRRYKGRLVTLILLGFAAICSSRYLFWRFDQTLGSSFNTDSFVATTLFSAELVYVLIYASGVIFWLWPVKELQITLSEDPTEWPKVSVFVVCVEQSSNSVEKTLTAIAELTWPKSKISLCFVDAFDRGDVRQVLDSSPARYMVYPDELRGVSGILNQAISESRDEIVVVLKAGQVVAKDLLLSTLGWFESDPTLAMVSTPHHFLIPPPSANFVNQFVTSGLDGEYVMLRRSMFVAVGGVPSEPVTPREHIAMVMRQAGLTHAYAVESPATQGGDFDSSAKMLCRFNNPFEIGVFQWKLRIDRYCGEIALYQPFMRFILTSAPLVYFLAHIAPINASGAVLISYALPHFTQALLVNERIRKSSRPPWWIELREVFLSIHLLVLTTLTVTFTKFNHVISDLHGRKNTAADNSRWPLGVIDAVFLLAFIAAIASGVVSGMRSVTVDRASDVLYGAWSCYILMLLAAKLAVAEEVQQIRLKKQLQRQMPAMVKLSNNRTIACSTTNFPNVRLILSMPRDLCLAADVDVNVSIFHHFDEFVFQATVLSLENNVMSVEVDHESLDDYASFANLAFARDEDWPKWLPDQDADQLVPTWIFKVGNKVTLKLMALLHALSKRRVNP